MSDHVTDVSTSVASPCTCRPWSPFHAPIAGPHTGRFPELLRPRVRRGEPGRWTVTEHHPKRPRPQVRLKPDSGRSVPGHCPVEPLHEPMAASVTRVRQVYRKSICDIDFPITATPRCPVARSRCGPSAMQPRLRDAARTEDPIGGLDRPVYSTAMKKGLK